MKAMREWCSKVFGGQAAVSMEALRKWHVAAAVILAGQALVVLLLSGGFSLPVYISFTTRDTLQSSLHQTTITAPAIRELLQINLSYLVAVMLLLSAFGYALLATLWRVRYEAWLRQGRQPLQWAITGIASGVILVLLALLAGMQQLDSLKMLGAFVIIASLGAVQLELQDRKGRPPLWAWVGVAISLLAAAVPLLVILLSLVASSVFGDASVTGATWWLYVTAAIGLLLSIGNTHAYRFRYGKWANYAYADCWASVIIVLIETAFTWQLFAAVLKP